MGLFIIKFSLNWKLSLKRFVARGANEICLLLARI